MTTNARILVVDDDTMNCLIVRTLLGKMGMNQIDVAANGNQALQLLQENHYRLVFMDLQMPGMGGCTTTSLLRNPASKALNPSVPVIALTASCIDTERDSCLASGMNDFICKPVTSATLLTILNNWL